MGANVQAKPEIRTMALSLANAWAQLAVMHANEGNKAMGQAFARCAAELRQLCKEKP